MPRKGESGENYRKDGIGAMPVAVSLTCQLGPGLIKAQRRLCKKPTAGNCHKVEALKTVT